MADRRTEADGVRAEEASPSAPQSFRAVILKAGTNPYVEVPPEVSRAFAGWAHAGRVAVSGRLNTTPLRATLVPAGGGRHRLFVNSGLRAAADVGPGDRADLEFGHLGEAEKEKGSPGAMQKVSGGGPD